MEILLTCKVNSANSLAFYISLFSSYSLFQTAEHFPSCLIVMHPLSDGNLHSSLNGNFINYNVSVLDGIEFAFILFS